MTFDPNDPNTRRSLFQGQRPRQPKRPARASSRLVELVDGLILRVEEGDEAAIKKSRKALLGYISKIRHPNKD